MAMLLGFEHVGLPVQDPQALADWYEDIFGATVLRPKPDGAFFVCFDNGFIFEIFQNKPLQEGETERPNTAIPVHLAFNVSDLESDRQAFIEKGVDYWPSTLSGPTFYFTDPVGNVIHFIQRDLAPIR